MKKSSKQKYLKRRARYYESAKPYGEIFWEEAKTRGIGENRVAE